MFIDFEGIDGSGKTTLSNRLAARLKKQGYRVVHARENGELQAPLARRVRELTRDPALLEMSPQAELFLNLARDAQQVDEVIKPALRRGDVCISDRYLYSQIALSHAGRGLPLEQLEGALATASQGLWPELVIFVDVDPELARLRKRVGKQLAGRAGSESRKGMSGAGLAVRMRESFLAQAHQAPDRWMVVENNDQPLEAVEQAILDAVLARLEGRESAARRLVPPVRPLPQAPGMSVAERFYAALDELRAREPQLAVFLLSGIPGRAAHERRVAHAEAFPTLVASSLSGLHDPDSVKLRAALAPVAPVQAVESLGTEPGPDAMALREALFAQAPAAVLASLKGDDGERAWGLRERAFAKPELWPELLIGLAGLDCDRAWRVREQGLTAQLHSAVARSLLHVSGERADALRASLWARDRLAVLRSTAGLDSPACRRFREALFAKAPKLVLRSLTGLDVDYAWELRERAAPHTKEALDSIDGMDTAAAWALRERYLERWTATAVSSLRARAGATSDCATSARGQALIAQALAKKPHSLAVLRNAYAALCAREQPSVEVGAERWAEAASVEAVA